MAQASDVDRAVKDAKQLLRGIDYDTPTTAEDLQRWFEADTPFDENFGLSDVLMHPLLVVHELVEIENVKRMGLALTKDVIVNNLEKVDDAHLIATEVELRVAASIGDVKHLRSRLENIRMWIDDDTVTPENKKKYGTLHSRTIVIIDSLV